MGGAVMLPLRVLHRVRRFGCARGGRQPRSDGLSAHPPRWVPRQLHDWGSSHDLRLRPTEPAKGAHPLSGFGLESG